MKLEEIIDLFQSVDDTLKVDLLLDFGRKLPEADASLLKSIDADRHRLHECQTPVFLWVTVSDDRVDIVGHVADEAPTVKGFLGLLIEAFKDSTPEEIAAAPVDLVEQLGLSGLFRMNRAVGLAAMINRIKREVGVAAASKNRDKMHVC